MSPILMELTADTSGTFTATVVIAGIVIVLAVLILLIWIFQLFGIVAPKINAWSEKRDEKRAEKKALKEKKKAAKKAAENGEIVPQKAEQPAAVSAPAAPAQPVAEEGISGEVVAAISAAVAQLEGGNVVIRSIRKKNIRGRNPWANAANMDNTRPF